jgi:REP element-mobilizing transposase RayT
MFFATTHFDPGALPIFSAERDAILFALDATRRRRFARLCAYVIMPTHVHLLFLPASGDSYSAFMREFKLRSARAVLKARMPRKVLWQRRSFDRIIRHRKEWCETLDYIHWNPVTGKFAAHPSDWTWSSWFGWRGEGQPPIAVDKVRLPMDEYAPLEW